MQNQLLSSIPVHSDMMMGSHVLIRDERGGILLIEENGVWKVPGGPWYGEGSLEDTARREVFQQTGFCLGTMDQVEIVSYESTECYMISALFEAKEILCKVDSHEKKQFVPVAQLYDAPLDQGHKELIYQILMKQRIGGVH